MIVSDNEELKEKIIDEIRQAPQEGLAEPLRFMGEQRKKREREKRIAVGLDPDP